MRRVTFRSGLANRRHTPAEVLPAKANCYGS